MRIKFIFHKVIFSLLLSILFPVVLFGYQYDLSVATIFKNNSPYLQEWIEYHRMMGVEHFYLYDNSSTDDPKTVLEPYIEEGVVTLIDWKNQHEESWGDQVFAWVWTTQIPAYHHAARTFKNKTKWMAFIDTDEFITPMEGASILPFLKRYDSYPGISLYWEVYGTSNVYDILPGKLMIELLTLKCNPEDSINQHTKIILKPKELNQFLDPHRCKFKNEKTGFVVPRETMRLNHYINRTVKFFYEHKVPNKQLMDNTKWSDEQIQLWSQLGNDVEDCTMDRFVPVLRKRMGLD